MIFTGKYGNMNFRIKIAYCPTIPCEYHISTIPTFTRRRDMHEEGTRLMTQGPTYWYSKLTSGSSKGCQGENERHVSPT